MLNSELTDLHVLLVVSVQRHVGDGLGGGDLHLRTGVQQVGGQHRQETLRAEQTLWGETCCCQP